MADWDLPQQVHQALQALCPISPCAQSYPADALRKAVASKQSALSSLGERCRKKAFWMANLNRNGSYATKRPGCFPAKGLHFFYLCLLCPGERSRALRYLMLNIIRFDSQILHPWSFCRRHSAPRLCSRTAFWTSCKRDSVDRQSIYSAGGGLHSVVSISMSTIAELQPKPLWAFFERLSQIPRPSKHEEKYGIGTSGKNATLCWESHSLELNLYESLP